MSLRAAAAALILASLCRTIAMADTRVSTLAGSGATGIDDGPVRQATFMLPMGIAYGAHGDLYVADAAAQRIRVVEASGTVRTLAGSGSPDASGVWVPGGFADGPGSRARFNRPAAVAVGSDDRVYVADSYNHCIRVIEPDSTVATFAGACGQPGYQLGARAVARFTMPTGLAFDRAGELYVVDSAIAGAIRKIGLDGTVTDVAMPGAQPTGGIALVDSTTGPTIALASGWGLYVHRNDGTVAVIRNKYYDGLCRARNAPAWVLCDQPEQPLREFRDIGDPVGVVALNDHTFVYTDYRTNTVRYVDLRTHTERRLAGSRLEDGAGHGGGAVDGDGEAARFNAPYGLVLRANGDLVLSELGSRRLRVLSDADIREPAVADHSVLQLGPASGQRVVYAGSELVWQGTTWSDSLEGRLEADLNTRRCPICGQVHVVPVVFGRLDDGVAALASLKPHEADAVVVQLSMLDAARLGAVDLAVAAGSPVPWRARLIRALRVAAADARARASRFLVVVAPLPLDIEPAAMLWQRAYDLSFVQSGGMALLERAVAASGVPYVSSWSAFLISAQSTAPAPLFAAAGFEYAAGGRETLAAAAAGALGAGR